jgi:hypothetical protein
LLQAVLIRVHSSFALLISLALPVPAGQVRTNHLPSVATIKGANQTFASLIIG